MYDLPQTKQSYVYNILREDIHAGRLRPGSRLTLADLRERFGVSHIPIREALRHLEKEGLIEIIPHSKALVKGISTQEALWAVELRIILEPLAAAQATDCLDEKALERLEGLILQMDKVVDSVATDEYIALNFELHKLVYSATPNQHLGRTVNEIAETINRYNLIVGQPQDFRLWHCEHKELLSALRAKDASKVEDIMRRHLAHGKELLKEELVRSVS